MTKHWWVRGAVYVGLVAGVVATVALMSRGDVVATAPASTWETRIEVVERAVSRGDVSAAISAWRRAYGEASRSRRWEALLAVGDAAVLIDDASGGRQAFRAEARRAYLAALFRARAAGSHDGMRRVSAAFAALGDGEMAERARAMAPEPPVTQAGR